MPMFFAEKNFADSLTRRLMVEVQPGLTFDLHEHGGDSFWMSARRQRTDDDEVWERRMANEAIRAVAASGTKLAPEDYSPGSFFQRLERGVYWLDAGKRGEAGSHEPGISKKRFHHLTLKALIMKRSLMLLAALFAAAFLGGCIVGDQLTTLTIHPDGSADYVLFRSNLRSTEKGTKAEKELADYKARFDARAEDEFVRIRDCGGKIVQAAWVRSEAPFSNVIHAQFPDASTLEKLGSAKHEDGSPLITTKFHRDGARRKLTVRVAVSPDSIKEPVDPPAKEPIKQAWANGISETRIAVVNGSIVAERGFTVASDKQSALLDGDEIEQLLRNGNGTVELFLEWEVTP